MKTTALLTWATLLAMASAGVAKQRPSKKNTSLTGTYQMRLGKGAGGRLLVKQFSPNKIEFDLNCNRGAPSYNMGLARASINVRSNVAVYRTTEFTGTCELKFQFKRNQVVVSQTGSDSDCGFGYGVYCGGTYRLKSRRPPKFEER